MEGCHSGDILAYRQGQPAPYEIPNLYELPKNKFYDGFRLLKFVHNLSGYTHLATASIRQEILV